MTRNVASQNDRHPNGQAQFKRQSLCLGVRKFTDCSGNAFWSIALFEHIHCANPKQRGGVFLAEFLRTVVDQLCLCFVPSNNDWSFAELGKRDVDSR